MFKPTYKERLKDIKTNPKEHQHDFHGLIKCCYISDVIDLRLLDAHRGIVPGKTEGGCDVLEGPCACGGWH